MNLRRSGHRCNSVRTGFQKPRAPPQKPHRFLTLFSRSTGQTLTTDNYVSDRQQEDTRRPRPPSRHRDQYGQHIPGGIPSKATTMKMKTFHKLGLAIALTACLPFAALEAAVIASWDLDNTTNGGLLPGGTNNFGPSPFIATTTASNVTVGGLTRGSGIGTTGSGALSGWGGNNFDTAAANLAAAIANNEFATFTFTPAVGYLLSFDDIAAYNIRRSGTGPTTGRWQYSVNGTDFFSIGVSDITWGATTSATGNNQAFIDLSGISALQNVGSGTTVTFRLATWGATNTGGTWYLNGASTNDALTLNGSVVPVPEPTGLALGGVGLVALAGIARVRRKTARSN